MSSSHSSRSHFSFLELAPEIRNKIYSLLLTKDNICIFSEYPSHQYVQCGGQWQRNPAPSDGTLGTCAICQRTPKLTGWRRFSFPILLVCSQIYDETSLLPYSLNTFVMHIERLLGFLHARSSAQLGSLRSLAIYSPTYSRSENICFRETMLTAAAEGLTGLEKFELALGMFESNAGDGFEAPWVKGVEAWMGRSLKVGLVTILDEDDCGDETIAPREWELQDMARQLSQRLMATEP